MFLFFILNKLFETNFHINFRKYSNDFFFALIEVPISYLSSLTNYTLTYILALLVRFGNKFERRLNAYMNALHKYFNKLGFYINVGKCVSVVNKGKPQS